MRTIYFTMGFSSIKLYLSPTEASYNVSPFSFQGEIIPCFVFLERNKNCGPFPILIFGIYLHSLFLCIAQSANCARNFDTF